MVGARTEGSCSGKPSARRSDPQLGFTVKITLVQRRDALLAVLRREAAELNQAGLV
jgi:hypothetical protein